MRFLLTVKYENAMGWLFSCCSVNLTGVRGGAQPSLLSSHEWPEGRATKGRRGGEQGGRVKRCDSPSLHFHFSSSVLAEHEVKECTAGLTAHAVLPALPASNPRLNTSSVHGQYVCSEIHIEKIIFVHIRTEVFASVVLIRCFVQKATWKWDWMETWIF